MYPISPLFEDFLKRRSREWYVKVDINGVEYGRDKIIDFEIDNSIVSGDDFEIGTAITSKLTLRLKSYDKLPDNAKVVPYLALSLDSMTWEQAETAWQDTELPWSGGTTEWMPLGEFYVDGRQQINASWEYVCYGKLMFANVPFISQLSYPATMQAVWDEICSSLGYEYDSTVVINPSYTFPVAPTGLTKRQVLAYIACVHAASVYEGKDGKIKFKTYRAAEDPIYEMDTSDYIRMKQVNPIKTYTRIVATYDTEQDLKYEAGEGDDNHTLFIESPLITQELVNDMHTKLNGFTFMPVSIDARGYPQLDIGDLLGVYRDDSLPWVDTHVAWEDMELPWNGLVMYKTVALKIKYTFKGGLSMTIDSNAQSEQQSEFKIDGSLSGQINSLKKTTLKQGRNYYGFTASLERGMEIQRDDGLSYLQLNSDIMDWQVEGQSVLYLDAIAKELRFAGTLYGADGVFSGTLEAGKIVGSEVKGGTIEGTIIRGSEFYGGTFSTREEGYPRIVISDTTDLLNAEYSETRKIMIDPNNYLTNQFPHLRWISDGYESHIHHGGASGLQITSDNVDFYSDVNIQGSNELWLASTTRLNFGNWNLQELLDLKVDEYTYNIQITDIERRLSALENA